MTPTTTTTTTTAAVNLPTMLHRAAGAENTRFALNGAMISSTDGGAMAYATDGRILAAVPLSSQVPVGEYIVPDAALPRLKGQRSIRLTIDGNAPYAPIGALDKHGNDVGLIDAKYPPLADVLPATGADVDGCTAGRVANDAPHISLGVDTLKRLLDALTDTRGSKADPDGKAPFVTLILSADKDGKHGRKPAIVLGNAGTGLVMPVANDGNAVEQYAERRAAIVANLSA
jgi:hypothetical protein